MITIVLMRNSEDKDLNHYDHVIIPDITRKLLLSLGLHVYVVFEALVQNVVAELNISVAGLSKQLGLPKATITDAIKILKQYNWFYVNDTYVADDNPNNKMTCVCIGYNSVAAVKGLPVKPEYDLKGVYFHQDDNEDYDDDNYDYCED